KIAFENTPAAATAAARPTHAPAPVTSARRAAADTAIPFVKALILRMMTVVRTIVPMKSSIAWPFPCSYTFLVANLGRHRPEPGVGILRVVRRCAPERAAQ